MIAGELTAAHVGRHIEVQGRIGVIDCIIHDATGTHLLTQYLGWLHRLPHDEPVQLLTLDEVGGKLTRDPAQPSLLEVIA